MSFVIVTGSAGLVGSEAASFFAEMGFEVVGIDNDMRRLFFSEGVSTLWQRRRLERQLGHSYRHVDADIRDFETISGLFAHYGSDIELVIHAAAQPSHDWAAQDPTTDFAVNAVGTLHLLKATRHHCPEAPFIFTSTNKVYGDTPNRLPLVELEQRWEIEPDHTYAQGIRKDSPSLFINFRFSCALTGRDSERRKSHETHTFNHIYCGGSFCPGDVG